MKQKCSKQDLLINGSISKALIWFALPLLGSSFIQLLYNAVDLIFIGNYVGKSASAAVVFFVIIPWFQTDGKAAPIARERPCTVFLFIPRRTPS